MKKVVQKSIAFQSNTIALENLPLNIVLYPGHYGAFFAFKESDESSAYFCSCSYEAIENYIKIRQLSPIPQNAYEHRMYILDSHHFPLSVVEDLMQKNVTESEVLNSLNFKEKLCHECNSQIPSLRYCHEMYGGTFKQNYGWYINKQAFEWAIEPLSLLFLPERCPDEVLDEMKIKPPTTGSGWADILQATDEQSKETIKALQKQNRKIRNIFENEVRRKFGHKKIGEAWTSETILYYIVKKLYPNYTIKRHYRPNFLDGLELDVYVDELKIGIEYQGVQHYKPVKHWGGKDALEKVKARDKKKSELCRQNDITLVYFEYNEGLNDEIVLDRVQSHVKL